MQKINLITIFIGYCALCACSEASQSNTAKGGAGSFHITAEGVLDIQSGEEKTTWENDRHMYWEFKNKDAKVRVSGLFAHDDVEQQLAAKTLIENNLFLEFKLRNGKYFKRILCSPDRDNVVGSINRVLHADGTSSGDFSIQFDTCKEYLKEDAFDEIELPLTVKGTFNKLALKP